MNNTYFNKLRVDNVSYDELLSLINNAIVTEKRINIAYANANTYNLAYKNEGFNNIINSFDIIHPDGIGIYLASLFTNQKHKHRFTGSDFYLKLINNSIVNNRTYYFFGHDKETLEKIQSNYPYLQIKGKNVGYDFETDKVIQDINNSGVDICIIGLNSPFQEKWIHKNKYKLNSKVVIAVGDGIKVFSGTKIRGPIVMQKLGLEWLIRLIANPLKYSKRYLIGNPLFLYRIIKLKISKLGNNQNKI